MSHPLEKVYIQLFHLALYSILAKRGGATPLPTFRTAESDETPRVSCRHRSSLPRRCTPSTPPIRSSLGDGIGEGMGRGVSENNRVSPPRRAPRRSRPPAPRQIINATNFFYPSVYQSFYFGLQFLKSQILLLRPLETPSPYNLSTTSETA